MTAKVQSPRPGMASWLRVTAVAVAVAMLGILLLVAERSTSGFSGTTDNSGNLLTAATLQPATNVQATTRCVGDAAPTVVGVSNSTGSDDQTVAMPAQVQAGDLLLAHVTDEDKPLSGPAGWSQLNETVFTSKLKTRVRQRIANGSDAGHSYTWASGGAKGAIGILAVRGAAGQVAAADASGINNGKSTYSDAPSRSVTVANSLLVTLHSAKKKNVTFGTPSGMTEQYDYPGGDDGALGAFTEVRTTTKATTIKTSTLSTNAENIGQSLLVVPATTSKVDLTWTPTTSTYATGHQVVRSGTTQALLQPSTTAAWTDENPGTGTCSDQVLARASNWVSAPAAVSVTPTC